MPKGHPPPFWESKLHILKWYGTKPEKSMQITVNSGFHPSLTSKEIDPPCVLSLVIRAMALNGKGHYITALGLLSSIMLPGIWTFKKSSKSGAKVGEHSLCLLKKASGSFTWIPRNLSFRYILFHEKRTPNDAVTQQRHAESIHTNDESKRETAFAEPHLQNRVCGTAFAEPRLLSS